MRDIEFTEPLQVSILSEVCECGYKFSLELGWSVVADESFLSCVGLRSGGRDSLMVWKEANLVRLAGTPGLNILERKTATYPHPHLQLGTTAQTNLMLLEKSTSVVKQLSSWVKAIDFCWRRLVRELGGVADVDKENASGHDHTHVKAWAPRGSLAEREAAQAGF